jgi:hypothetical protein
MRGFGSGFTIPIFCAVLAMAVRLPSVPSPNAAAPWCDGTRALLGTRDPVETAPFRTDLVVAIPLVVAQRAGWILTGHDHVANLGPVGWARKHEGFGRGVLWGMWLLAAMGCAYLAARAGGGAIWGALAGGAVALVPVGIAGTERLDPWALAAFFLIAAFLARRRWMAVACWSAVISLSPIGLPAALVTLLLGRRHDRLAVLFAIPIWFALDPLRLTNPGAAIPRYLGALVVSGWPGFGDGPLGRLLIASWSPGIIAALLVCAGGAAALGARDRRWMAASGIALVLWIIPALVGARRPDGMGLAVPVSLASGAIGARWIAERASDRARTTVTAVLLLLWISPIVRGDFVSIHAHMAEKDRAGNLDRLLASEVGAKGLLLRDPLAPVVSDSIAVFTLPTHVDRPEAFDFAWWPGWYGSFTHALFTVRTLETLQADRTRRPASFALAVALARHARVVGTIGEPETDRSALVLYRLGGGPPWDFRDGEKTWGSVHGGGIEARFLSDLATFLGDHGHADRAVPILRVALRWDEDNPKVATALGSILLSMGEWKDAAELLEEKLRSNPSSIEMRYTLARAYIAGDVPGRAETELKRVLSARPNFAAAHYEMARAAAAAGEWAVAAAALENYLAREPDPPNRPQIEQALAEARRRAEELRNQAKQKRDGR